MMAIFNMCNVAVEKKLRLSLNQVPSTKVLAFFRTYCLGSQKTNVTNIPTSSYTYCRLSCQMVLTRMTMIPCSMKGSFDAGRFITVVRNLNNTSKFKATVVHMSKERKQGSDKLLAIIVTIH